MDMCSFWRGRPEMQTLEDGLLELDSVVRAGVYRLTVGGHLTVRTCSMIRTTLGRDASDTAHDIVIIDLRDLVGIDAAGLAAVTAPAMRMRRRGQRLQVLLPTRPEARRVVDMAGVLPLLNKP